MRSSLTLAFILRDEAETIEEVIKSFWFEGQPMYQELIVGIDRSTKDETYEKVKPYADNIFYFYWNNDFSEARNAVIKACTQDWIFMPDGHEFLDPACLPALNFVLESAPEDIWLISPYVWIDDRKPCCLNRCSIIEFPSFVFPRPMLWRRKHNLRFVEPVHNYLDAPIEHKKIMPELFLTHRQPKAREIRRTQQREQMNIPGLEKRMQEDPQDNRALFYLANTYGDLQRPEEALAYYKAALEKTGNLDQRAQIRISAAYMLCILAQNTDGDKSYFEQIREILLPGAVERWDRGEIYFMLGWAAQKLEHYPEALHWLTLAITLDYPITGFFLRTEMYTYAAWECIMEVKAKLGDFLGASEAAQKVLHWKPNCKTAQGNLKRIEEFLLEQKAGILLEKVMGVGVLP